MKLHANAALGPKGRKVMVGRVVEEGWSIAEAATTIKSLAQLAVDQETRRRRSNPPPDEPTRLLDLRPNCELCDADLPPDAPDARICSYECTFCADCVDRVLRNVCPNCGGGFVPRPFRPRQAWRPGIGLEHHPPAAHREHSPHSLEAIQALSALLHDTPPDAR